MRLSLPKARTHHRRRWYVIVLATALIACFCAATLAAPNQDPSPGHATDSPKSGIGAPAPNTVSNAPREPQQLPADQLAQHSLLTDREQMLSYAILLFGLAVLIVQYLLLRSPKRNSFEILQLLGINLIVTGTLFLITAGFSAQQISPGLGLFGTIAGYVLGRRTGDPPKSDGAGDGNRGAT